MQGAQKLRSEAHLRVRRNDEVAAQRSRWTFYETIKVDDLVEGHQDDGFDCKGVLRTPMAGRAPLAPTMQGAQIRW